MTIYEACGLTVIVETAFFALIGCRNKGFLAACAAVNVGTNLSLNLVVSFFGLYGSPLIYALEVAVVGIEYGVYAAVRGRSWRLLALTAAANALSFGVGLLLQ